MKVTRGEVIKPPVVLELTDGEARALYLLACSVAMSESLPILDTEFADRLRDELVDVAGGP